LTLFLGRPDVTSTPNQTQLTVLPGDGCLLTSSTSTCSGMVFYGYLAQYLVKLTDSRFGLSLSANAFTKKSSLTVWLKWLLQLRFIHSVSWSHEFLLGSGSFKLSPMWSDSVNGHEVYHTTRDLTFGEIEPARIICVKYAQGCFQEDYCFLLGNPRSQLVKLAPKTICWG